MFKQALEDEEKKVEYVPNIGEWLKDSYDEMVDQETDTKEITQSQIEAFREEWRGWPNTRKAKRIRNNGRG